MNHLIKPYRVMFYPELGGRNVPFLLPVDSLADAVAALNVIADYDNFLVRSRLRPDHANAGYVEQFEGGEWLSWQGPDGEDDPEEYLKLNSGGINGTKVTV